METERERAVSSDRMGCLHRHRTSSGRGYLQSTKFACLIGKFSSKVLPTTILLPPLKQDLHLNSVCEARAYY